MKCYFMSRSEQDYVSLECEFQRIAEKIKNNLSDSIRIGFDDPGCLRIVIASDS